MITLYHASNSCSLAINAALELTGLDYEVKLVNLGQGEHLKAEYLKINPLGKVPALGIDNFILTEGAAIMLHLNNLAPSANLFPKTNTRESAEAYRWLLFLYSNLHPHFARAFSPGRYGTDETDIKTKAEAAIFDLFKLIDAQLANQPYIAGAQLTAGDLYLMVAIHWQGILSHKLTEEYKNLNGFIDRMFAHETVGKIFKAELA